jgi:peptidoglycan-N-acetylglucosamine deacetylase
MAFRRLAPLAVACALTLASAAPAHARPVSTGKPFCATHKCIALTFDDGPAGYTDDVLKILKKHKAKATFFAIGERVKKHPILTKSIVKAGHEIGNHTWDHTYLTGLTYEQIYKQIKDTQTIIKKLSGKTPKVFRAPGGLTDVDVQYATAKLGLIQIPGTSATQDFIKEYRDPEYLAERAVEIAAPGEVVLMHETVKATVQSLPTVLKKLRAQKYYFVTVSKLLEGEELTPGQEYPEELPLSEDVF